MDKKLLEGLLLLAFASTTYVLLYFGMEIPALITSIIGFIILYNYSMITHSDGSTMYNIYMLFVPLIIGITVYVILRDITLLYYIVYTAILIILFTTSRIRGNTRIYVIITTREPYIMFILFLAVIALSFNNTYIYWFMLGPLIEYILLASIVNGSSYTSSFMEELIYVFSIPLLFIQIPILTVYSISSLLFKHLLDKWINPVALILVDYIIRIVFIAGVSGWITGLLQLA